jgi:hypothetical protein
MLLTVFPFKSLSVHNPSYHQQFLNVCWEFKLITYGYEPPVTDVSKPNKQIHQKCSATQSIHLQESSGAWNGSDHHTPCWSLENGPFLEINSHWPRTIKFPLTTTCHCDWPNTHRPSYITDTFLPLYRFCRWLEPVKSLWKWRKYIFLKQRTHEHYIVQIPKRRLLFEI